MKLLIILNHQPYDGSDVTRNALRLVDFTLKAGDDAFIFLMNDAVDLAREGANPGGYDTDLGSMLVELMGKGVPVKLCGSCLARCGMYRGNPLLKGAVESSMPELVAWIKEADRVITF